MQKFFYTILGLIIIVASAWAAWIFITTAWSAYVTLSDDVKTAIFVGLFTLITTLGSVAYTKIKEKQLQLSAANNMKKQKLYTKFTSQMIDLLANPDLGNDSEKMAAFRIDFMKNSFLWADSEVLEAYHKFRINTQNNDDDGEQMMWDVTGIFIAMRKDLGLSNKKVNRHVLTEILYDKKHLSTFYLKFPKK